MVGVLQSSGQLTPAKEFVGRMMATLQTWQAEPVPEIARHRANQESEQHKAMWEARVQDHPSVSASQAAPMGP